MEEQVPSRVLPDYFSFDQSQQQMFTQFSKNNASTTRTTVETLPGGQKAKVVWFGVYHKACLAQKLSTIKLQLHICIHWAVLGLWGGLWQGGRLTIISSGFPLGTSTTCRADSTFTLARAMNWMTDELSCGRNKNTTHCKLFQRHFFLERHWAALIFQDCTYQTKMLSFN